MEKQEIQTQEAFQTVVERKVEQIVEEVARTIEPFQTKEEVLHN